MKLFFSLLSGIGLSATSGLPLPIKKGLQFGLACYKKPQGELK